MACISLLLIPFYIRRGYLYLIEEKAKAYLVLSIPFLFVAAGIVLASVFICLKSGEYVFRNRGLEKRKSFIILFLIAAWTIISTCLSPDRLSSLLGLIGWLMGSLLLCSLVGTAMCTAAWFPGGAFGAFLFREPIYKRNEELNLTGSNERAGKRCREKTVSGYSSFSPGSLHNEMVHNNRTAQLLQIGIAVFLTVHAIILLFAILQEAGVDLFGLLTGLDHHYIYSYLSTIGQKNCFAGYLCLLLPLFWGYFMECKVKIRTAVCAGFCAAGFLCAALIDSDSVYAGFGFCLLFLMPFVLYRRARARRGAILILLFGGSLTVAGSFPVFSDRVSHMEGISATMLSRPCAIAVLAAGALLLLYSTRCMPEDREGGDRRTKMLLFLLEALVLTAAAGAVIYTALHFSDDWGTNRGLIWRTGWEQFLQYSLLRKIAGIGPGMLPVTYAVLRVNPGINVVSAHCEPLHILLTQGIIGLFLYLLLWSRFLLLWVRNHLWKDRRAILFCPLAAFFGSSLFCPLYPVTAAFFSVIAGLYLQAAE